MIRLYPKLPAPEDLDGKIVLCNPSFHWSAVGQPRRVVARTGSKLTVEKVAIAYDPSARDGKGGVSTTSPYIHTGEDTREHWMAVKVKATCDTLAEAVHLIHLSEDAAEAFNTMLVDAKRNLLATNGLEIHDPEPEAQPAGPGM